MLACMNNNMIKKDAVVIDVGINRIDNPDKPGKLFAKSNPLSLFGFFPGIILASFASSLGALLCFLIARYLFKNLIEQKFNHSLKKINCPTLCIFGDLDKMVPLKVGNNMSELIKNSKTKVIQNCGHMIIFEKAFEMRKLVKEFLIENKK